MTETEQDVLRSVLGNLTLQVIALQAKNVELAKENAELRQEKDG